MCFKQLLSNEQAFRALASGEASAFSLLMQNFTFFIRGRAGFFVAMYDDVRLDFQELDSIGQLGLMSAIKLYRGDHIPFPSFATVVIQNAMLNYIKHMRSPTVKMLQNGISLDESLFENNNTLLMSDIITEQSMEKLLGLYSPADIGYIEDRTPCNFNEFELKVIELKLKGYTYDEIRKKLKVPKRKLDHTISQLKIKWDNDDE